MAIKIGIEEGLCCGWGNCAQVCPQVFELDPESNRVRLRLTEVSDGLVESVRYAVSGCPTEAIVILSTELMSDA